MVPNDEKGVNPTVMTIVEMFPDNFLRDTAREKGFVKRERKIDPVILFWVFTIGFGVRFLDDKLKRFKDLFIQDSTIIRLHESLTKIWPATRTKKVAAGVKVSCIISDVADGPKSVRIYPERTSEAKILRLGPWLKGAYPAHRPWILQIPIL
jgi:hypothetical protein